MKKPTTDNDDFEWIEKLPNVLRNYACWTPVNRYNLTDLKALEDYTGFRLNEGLANGEEDEKA